jgi:death-on-curing protein
MIEPIWMDLVDALAIHEKMLAQHGGGSGVRDQGLLESALAKPQHRYFYESAALPQLAASYAAGVVLNHPFIDGNKRTGFMLAAAFLEINGWRFTADEADAVIQTLALATGELNEAGYAVWLEANSRPG